MKIVSITGPEFDKLNGSSKIIVHDYPRRYGALRLGRGIGVLGLSWRSDQLDPIVQETEDGQAVWVGIDQRLCVISLTDGHIALLLNLNSNLLKLSLVAQGAIALTETDAFVFNSDFTIRYIKGLPDLADSIATQQKMVSIRLTNGETLSFDIDTGK